MNIKVNFVEKKGFFLTLKELFGEIWGNIRGFSISGYTEVLSNIPYKAAYITPSTSAVHAVGDFIH